MKRHGMDAGILRAVGAMSGTSLDGVDVAVVETDGIEIAAFGEVSYRAYTPEERAVLRAGLGHWQGPEVQAAARVVQSAHVEALYDIEAELVGFHGQTLAHAPRAEGTLQAGDGQALADALGRPVVWDFRSADVALGGEGAPLAPFFHFACARWAGLQEPVAFLNLGGVGNLTWLDPKAKTPEAEGALLAFDTGPANAPVDDEMQARFGEPCDEDGHMAAQGRIAAGALEIFLADPFFAKPAPKSLDRNDFAQMRAHVAALPDADAIATLTGMCAAAVAQGIDQCPSLPTALYVTGGGRHNPVLMRMLKAGLSCDVAPVEHLGLDGDMLEAQAFAYLSVRVAQGLPTSCPATTGVRAAVGGGVISRPQVPRSGLGGHS